MPVHYTPHLIGFRIKTDSDGGVEKYKVRCTLGGHRLIPGVHYDATRSAAHTPSHTAKRLLYADAALHGHHLETWDIPGAYSRAPADPRYRQTMTQPPHADGSYTAPGCLAVMDKAMNGCGDSNRLWVDHRDAKIVSWHWTRLPCEPSTFYLQEGDSFIRLVADTDDFLTETNDIPYLHRHRRRFLEEWQITIQDPIRQHCNLKIDVRADGILVSNPKKIDELLHLLGLHDCHPSPTPHTDGADLSARLPDEPQADVGLYQSVIGRLRYLADTTVPSIAFITGYLARYLHDPSPRHLQACKRVIRYLRGVRSHGLLYSPSPTAPTAAAFQAFSDSDWAYCPDTRRSTTGSVIMYANAPIHWSSRLQPTIAHSSSEAEYVAAASTARDVAWLVQLARGWCLNLTSPGHSLALCTADTSPVHTLHIGNQGAIAMAHASGPTKRTKHIDVKHHYLQQQVARRLLHLRSIPTADQLADTFTKPLKRVLFSHSLTLLNASCPSIEGGCCTTHTAADRSKS